MNVAITKNDIKLIVEDLKKPLHYLNKDARSIDPKVDKFPIYTCSIVTGGTVTYGKDRIEMYKRDVKAKIIALNPVPEQDFDTQYREILKEAEYNSILHDQIRDYLCHSNFRPTEFNEKKNANAPKHPKRGYIKYGDQQIAIHRLGKNLNNCYMVEATFSILVDKKNTLHCCSDFELKYLQ